MTIKRSGDSVNLYLNIMFTTNFLKSHPQSTIQFWVTKHVNYVIICLIIFITQLSYFILKLRNAFILFKGEFFKRIFSSLKFNKDFWKRKKRSYICIIWNIKQLKEPGNFINTIWNRSKLIHSNGMIIIALEHMVNHKRIQNYIHKSIAFYQLQHKTSQNHK